MVQSQQWQMQAQKVYKLFVLLTFLAGLSGCGDTKSALDETAANFDCVELNQQYKEATSDLEGLRDEQSFLSSLIASRVTPTGREIRSLELQQQLLRRELQISCPNLA